MSIIRKQSEFDVVNSRSRRVANACAYTEVGFLLVCALEQFSARCR